MALEFYVPCDGAQLPETPGPFKMLPHFSDINQPRSIQATSGNLGTVQR